jgi:DNA-binding NarL/FixJ family response regulator
MISELAEPQLLERITRKVTLTYEDILLLDVHLPDMDEEVLLKEIRAVNPSQKIIYLTLMRGTVFIHRLLKYGIQGYILKNARWKNCMKL